MWASSIFCPNGIFNAAATTIVPMFASAAGTVRCSIHLFATHAAPALNMSATLNSKNTLPFLMTLLPASP